MERSDHLIITLHGIRTYGRWQQMLGDLVAEYCKDHGQAAPRIVHRKFGWFSVVAFLVPPLRWWQVYNFSRTLLLEQKAGNYSRIDLVGHSFGTHVIGWGLRRALRRRSLPIHTVILAGSVLKSDFPWDRLILERQVRRVCNDCGARDNVLILSQVFVLLTGMAGRVGFAGNTHKDFQNRYSDFGHSGYFRDTENRWSDQYMKMNWLPLLVTSEDIVPFEHRTDSALRGVVDVLAKNAAPLNASIYIVLPVVGLVWVSNLYIDSESQRRQIIADLSAERAAEIASTPDRDIRFGALHALRASRLLSDSMNAAALVSYYAKHLPSLKSIRETPSPGRPRRVAFSDNELWALFESGMLRSLGKDGWEELAEIAHLGHGRNRILRNRYLGNGFWLDFNNGTLTANFKGGREIVLWETGSREQVSTDRIRFATSVNGNAIAVVASGEVRSWVVRPEGVEKLLAASWSGNPYPSDLAVSDDAKWVVVGKSRWRPGSNSHLIYDQEGGARPLAGERRQVWLLTGHSDWILSETNGRIWLEDPSQTQASRELANLSRMENVALGPDGRLLAATFDHQTVVWDIGKRVSREVARLPHEHRSMAAHVTMSGASENWPSVQTVSQYFARDQIKPIARLSLYDWELSNPAAVDQRVQAAGREDAYKGMVMDRDGRLGFSTGNALFVLDTTRSIHSKLENIPHGIHILVLDDSTQTMWAFLSEHRLLRADWPDLSNSEITELREDSLAGDLYISNGGAWIVDSIRRTDLPGTTLLLHDLNSLSEPEKFEFPQSRMEQLVVHRSGDFIVAVDSAPRREELVVLNTRTRQLRRFPLLVSGFSTGLSFAADGSPRVTVNGHREWFSYDVERPRLVNRGSVNQFDLEDTVGCGDHVLLIEEYDEASSQKIVVRSLDEDENVAAISTRRSVNSLEAHFVEDCKTVAITGNDGIAGGSPYFALWSWKPAYQEQLICSNLRKAIPDLSGFNEYVPKYLHNIEKMFEKECR